jgi:hypothetical protein
MAQDGYPPDPRTWRSFERIERRAISAARFSVFVTPSAAQMYRERYPERAKSIRLVENGYSEEVLGADERFASEPLNPGRVTILHSGIVYPEERNPTELFRALSELRRNAPASFDRLKLRFRAPVHSALLEQLATKFGVESAIEILPSIDYACAIAEMRRADALLVLQANNCNAQIPAKLYEYFSARRPMLVLADPVGDTAAAARMAGVEAIAPLEDGGAIAVLFERFAAGDDVGAMPSVRAIEGASRRARTRVLAALLDEALRAET